jgi:hypothetical protein
MAGGKETLSSQLYDPNQDNCCKQAIHSKPPGTQAVIRARRSADQPLGGVVVAARVMQWRLRRQANLNDPAAVCPARALGSIQRKLETKSSIVAIKAFTLIHPSPLASKTVNPISRGHLTV